MARTKEEQELYERAFEEARERRRGQHEQIVNRTQELLAQRVARDEQARMNAAVQQEPSVSQVQNEAQWPGGIMLPGTFGTNAQNMYSRAFEAPDIAQQTRTQPKSQYEQMNAVKQAWDASDPAATNRVMTALKNSQEANAPENTNRLYRAALLSSPVPDREAADKELSDSLASLSQSTGVDEQTLYSWAERMQNPDELAAEMDYYRQNEAAMRMLGEEEQAALRRAAEKITDAVPVNKYTSWEEKKARKEAQELLESTAEKLGISSKSLKNYLQRQNNEENMADVEQTSKTLGAEHPVLSSAGSVVSSLLGRVPSAVDYGVQYLSGKLGNEYLPLDTNTKWQALSRATQEIRGQVSGDLEEAVQDATGSDGLGSAASLVYNAGLSGVDSIAQGVLLGGNPILVGIGAGAGAFSDTVTSAKEKGASDSQAMAAGVASGIAESLFEQISLGNLKAMAKVNPKGLRDVVLNFGKSLAVEGSEEAMTEAANIVADAIIMGDVSDYNIAKNAWMEAGSSEDEAEKQALKELIVRVAMAGAGGMIMGAGTSGAGMAYSAANTYNTGRQINQSGNLGELIGQGLSTDATSEAYTQAAQLAQKQLEGARIGNYETGRLANDLAMWRNADGVFMPPLPQNEAQTPGVFHQAAQQRALEEAKVTEEELSAIDRMASDKGLNVEYVYDTASGVDGFIRGNTITVNLASDSASFGTAVHEIGHSMRQANEEQYVKFQNAVLRMAEQDETLSDYANQVRSMYTAQNSPALNSLLNEDGTVNSAALDEEVSLKLAEQIVSDPQKLTEAVSGDRGLMATFLDFVRGIKNSIAIKLTNSQKAMLDEAERTLVNLLRGEAGNVDGTRYSIDKDGKERYDNFKPFGEQVDDAVNGRMPRANDLLMGETPQVLQKVGLNALPMTMTARHAQTIYNSNGQDQNANYHGLGELLKQLPEAMKDPVAVIRSETRRGNSVVVLADLKDQSGNSVVVPVRVDGYGRLNDVEIDANAAASAYGKKNAVAGLLKNALAAEAQGEVGVYYINKNKAKSPSLAAGVQFPGGVHGLDGFIHSIHEQKADVNTSLPDVTGSKQFKRWFGDWQKSPMSASKIVDAEGKPLVMYHGTRAENGDFAVFDADKAVKKGGLGMKAMGKGNYFTSTKLNGTERYGSRVIPAYLNIRKPFIYEGGKSFQEQVGEVLHTDASEMNHDELQALLRRNGYDGVVQRNKEGDINIAVAFDSDQIKSADRNIGTFEKNDPNIYHSLNIPYSLPDGRSLREYLNEQYRGEPITWTDEATGKRLQMVQTENGAAFPPTNAEEPAAAVPGAMTEEAARSKVPDRMQSTEQEDAAWEQYMPNGWQNLPIEQQIALSERAQKRAEQAAAEQPAQSRAVRAQAMDTAENMERFASEIDGVFNGTKSKAKMIEIGDTPELYEQFGVKPLKITITPATINKIAYPAGYQNGKHNLGIPAVKKLPQQLQNPSAILKSASQPNSLVVLTEWADTQGNPVVVPLHLDKKGAVTLENRVASAYGKQGIEALLGEKGENVLWTKGNEDIHQILSVRLQLPQAVSDDTLVSNYSIQNQQENASGTGESQADAAPVNQAERDPRELPEVKAVLEDENAPQGEPVEVDFELAAALGNKGVNYSKDLGRNLDAAAGGNKKAREWLRGLVEKPFYAAKKRYAQSIVKNLDRYKQAMDELGIRPGSRESKAVMWYGEGRRKVKGNEYESYSIAELRNEFPNSWEKIQKADEVNRKLYNEYIDRINSVLDEIYPQVMEKAQAKLDKLEANLDYYRKQLSEATDPKEIERMQRNVQLTRGEVNALRAQIETGDVLRNKRLIPRQNYYHHVQEISQGFSKLAQILSTPADISTNLVGVSDFTKPKSRWAGFMQQREGGFNYSEDSIAAMVDYMKDAEYKVNMDPIIARNRNIIKGLAEQTKNTRNANKFIEWMTDWTNDLAGKTNPIDRALQKITDRKSMQVLRWLNNRVKANAVVGNLNSAVSQFFNLPNAAAYIKNPADWAQGAAIYMGDLVGDTKSRNALNQSGFLLERYGVDKAEAAFDNGVLKAPAKFANWLLTFGDQQMSKLIWSSAYAQGLRKGEADPVQYADDITRRSVAGRGVGEVPLFQKSEIVKLLAPFQVEVNNSWQLLKERVHEKDAAGLLLIFLASWLMNGISEKITGNRVVFDPIDAAMDGVKNAKEEAESEGRDAQAGDYVTSIGGRLLGETLSAMPMGSQIATNLLGLDSALGFNSEKFFGDSDPTRYGTGNVGLSALTKPALEYLMAEDKSKVNLLDDAMNLLPPFGGKQIARTIGAAQDMGFLPDGPFGLPIGNDAEQAPGSYTASGNLRFPIDTTDPVNVAAGLMFGSYGTKEGKEYIQNGAQAKGSKYTQAYRNALQNNISGEQFDEWWNRMDLNADGKVTEKEALTSLPHLNGVADSTKAFLWSQTAGDTSLEGYRAAQDNGVGNEYFQMRMEADQDKPGESGYGSISSTEMKDWLRQQELELDKQAALWKTMATYDQQYDYATAQRQGVGDLYVDLLLNADQLYGDGNGYLNKAEIMAYLDAAQLELDVKRLLFGMVSSAKNPY